MSTVSFTDVVRGVWERNTAPRKAAVKALPAPEGSPLERLSDQDKALATTAQSSTALIRYSDAIVRHTGGAFNATLPSRIVLTVYGDDCKPGDALNLAGGIGVVGGGVGVLACIFSSTVGAALMSCGLALGVLAGTGYVVLQAARGLQRGRWSKREQPQANVVALRAKVEAARVAAGDNPLAQALAYLAARRAIDTMNEHRVGVSEQTELWMQEVVCDRPKVSDEVMQLAEHVASMVVAGALDARPETLPAMDRLSADQCDALRFGIRSASR